MTAIACKYFIQNETIENDTTASNLFMLSKKYNSDEKIKFKDVMTEFPLNNLGETSYHLRFQTFLPEAPNSPIWVDILNEEASVPLAEPGLVRIKALRLPSGLKQKLKQCKPAPVTSDFGLAPTAAAKPIPHSDSEDEFDLGSINNTPFKEEQKKTRPRIDSDTKRAAFDIVVESNIDLTPPLQPTAYSEASKKPPNVSQPTAAKVNTQIPITTQPKETPQRQSQPSMQRAGPARVDIVQQRVNAAVSG